MNAGTLEIQLLANVARLQSDMTQAKGIVGSAMADMSRAVAQFKSVLGGLGIGLGVAGLASMVKGTIDALDHLNDLSKTTGIAVEQLAGLSLAARQSGSDLDGTAKAINMLAQNMGKGAEKFNALGVSARDPLKALQQLSDVFVSIQDPQQRAAVMAEALGKNWQAAAPLLAEGGARIGEMVEQGAKLSGITDAMAKQADELNDKWLELTGTGRTMINVVGPLLPLLNALADTFIQLRNSSDGGGPFTVLAEVLRVLIVVGGNVLFVLKGIGNEIAGIAAQLAALVRGDFAQFAQIAKEMKADAVANRTAFDLWESSIMAVGTAAKATGSVLDAMDQVQRRAASDASARAREFLEYEKRKAQAAKDAADAARALARAQREEWDFAFADLKDQLKELKEAYADLDKMEKEFGKNIIKINQDIAESIGEDVIENVKEGMKVNKEWEQSWERVGEAAGSFLADLAMNWENRFEIMRRWVKQLLADLIALFAKRWILNMAAGGGGGGADAGGILGSLASSYLGGVGAEGGMSSFMSGLGAAGGALWIFAGIVAGVAASAGLYSRGWGVNGSTGITNTGFKLGPEAMISGTAFKIGQMFGLSDKWASILSGQTLVSRTFGRGATHPDAYGISGAIGAGGFTGEQWQDMSQRGGVFSSDRRWTERSAFSPEQITFLKGIFDGVAGVTGALGSSLGVNTSTALAGYSHPFNMQLSENGEPLSEEAMQKLFGDAIGTVLQEQVAIVLRAGGEGELADYITSLTATGDALTQQITEFVGVYAGLQELDAKGLDIDALLAWKQGNESLAETFQRVAGQLASFDDLFMSDAQKLERAGNQITDAFGKMGIAIPANKQAFYDLVHSLDLSTQAGRDFFDALMAIAPAFNFVATQVTTPVEDLNTAISDTGKQAAIAAAEIQKNLQQAKLSLGAFLNGLLQDDALSPLSLQEKLALAKKTYEEDLRHLNTPEGIAAAQEAFKQYLTLLHQTSAGPDYTAEFRRGYQTLGRTAIGERSWQDAFSAAVPRNSTIASRDDIRDQTSAYQRGTTMLANIINKGNAEVADEIGLLRKDVKNGPLKPAGTG